jgi:hypothetical protein
MQDVMEGFRKYNHPFEYVLDLITRLRQLKAEHNLSSKPIEDAYIWVKNDLAKLGLALESGFDIRRLCKVNNLYINYVDDEDELNNFCLRYEDDKQTTLFFNNTHNS